MMNNEIVLRNSSNEATSSDDRIDVLLCASCGTILGDNNPSNFIDFIPSDKFIVLKRTTEDVFKGNKMTISPDKFDSGCVYNGVKCNCGVVVGRYYTAVTKECINWTQCYGFFMDTLKLYTINLNKASSGNKDFMNDISIMMSTLMKKIEMLQMVAIECNRRIEDLEECHR